MTSRREPAAAMTVLAAHLVVLAGDVRTAQRTQIREGDALFTNRCGVRRHGVGPLLAVSVRVRWKAFTANQRSQARAKSAAENTKISQGERQPPARSSTLPALPKTR
jgi:hypothetical protein